MTEYSLFTYGQPSRLEAFCVDSKTITPFLSNNKWIDRSRVGIFLNYSPVHASSVPLVLNTTTACVSPQFHCLYDDEFATCKQDSKFKSYWQYKAKLKEGNQSLIDLLTNDSI